ncbi:MAG TPA: J domain-containing protein [Dehalococcoidales bacterium]|nr:J domain-containing protein [Dehalococcoidales bacterium]
MAGKDYYSILGVSRTATDKDIKAAYRRLARIHHPDVNPGNKEAESRFKEINQAFEVLSDSEKRQKYDKYGENWQHGEQMAEAARQQAAAGGRGFYQQGGGDGQTIQFEEGDLESIFGDLLGGRMGGYGRRTSRPRKGQDLEYEVEVSLEESFNGATRNISLQSESPCSSCRGTGRIQNLACSVCRGAGVVSEVKRLEVRIPAGVDTGSRVRIAGKGQAGTPGGLAGDLYLVINVSPHPQFKRQGDELVVDVHVPLTTAVLGGEIQVPTLKGSRLMLKIPPETQNEQVFRLTGQGMPHLGSAVRGDFLVNVKVTLPKGLSTEERTLFNRLREIRPG